MRSLHGMADVARVGFVQDAQEWERLTHREWQPTADVERAFLTGVVTRYTGHRFWRDMLHAGQKEMLLLSRCCGGRLAFLVAVDAHHAVQQVRYSSTDDAPPQAPQVEVGLLHCNIHGLRVPPPGAPAVSSSRALRSQSSPQRPAPVLGHYELLVYTLADGTELPYWPFCGVETDAQRAARHAMVVQACEDALVRLRNQREENERRSAAAVRATQARIQRGLQLVSSTESDSSSDSSASRPAVSHTHGTVAGDAEGERPSPNTPPPGSPSQNGGGRRRRRKHHSHVGRALRSPRSPPNTQPTRRAQGRADPSSAPRPLVALTAEPITTRQPVHRVVLPAFERSLQDLARAYAKLHDDAMRHGNMAGMEDALHRLLNIPQSALLKMSPKAVAWKLRWLISTVGAQPDAAEPAPAAAPAPALLADAADGAPPAPQYPTADEVVRRYREAFAQRGEAFTEEHEGALRAALHARAIVREGAPRCLHRALKRLLQTRHGVSPLTEAVVDELRRLHPQDDQQPQADELAQWRQRVDGAPLPLSVDQGKLASLVAKRVNNGSAPGPSGWTGHHMHVIMQDDECGRYMTGIITGCGALVEYHAAVDSNMLYYQYPIYSVMQVSHALASRQAGQRLHRHPPITLPSHSRHAPVTLPPMSSPAEKLRNAARARLYRQRKKHTTPRKPRTQEEQAALLARPYAELNDREKECVRYYRKQQRKKEAQHAAQQAALVPEAVAVDDDKENQLPALQAAAAAAAVLVEEPAPKRHQAAPQSQDDMLTDTVSEDCASRFRWNIHMWGFAVRQQRFCTGTEREHEHQDPVRCAQEPFKPSDFFGKGGACEEFAHWSAHSRRGSQCQTIGHQAVRLWDFQFVDFLQNGRFLRRCCHAIESYIESRG